VNGSVSGVVSFRVANADRLFESEVAAFDDLGGTYDDGRSMTVSIGARRSFLDMASTLVSRERRRPRLGPYVAY
jgi:hypothetical protein